MRARRALTSDGQARATKTADRATHSARALSPSPARDERATEAECGPSAGPDERATGQGPGAAAGRGPSSQLSISIAFCAVEYVADDLPSREQRRPSREQRRPSREQRRPSREQRRPSREQRRPSREQRRPSREQPGASR